MSGYNLITLNASKILDNFNVVQLENKNYKAEFKYDLSDKSEIRSEIILSTDKYDKNALFYQIEQVLDNVSDENEDKLQQVIIFVDFDEVFKNKKDFNTSKNYRSLKIEDFDLNSVYRLKWIFDAEYGGITLTFDGNITKTFVPFDKSASMSRECKMSFIDKELKSEIDKRLLLGIDFSEIDVIASKYYAYRGLYLSSGYRIDQDEHFRLNHETVIVIDDVNKKVSNKVFTAKLNENEELWECFEVEDNNLSINVFDGEGLISPEYANIVNRILKVDYQFNKDSHSFQVRMPFIKGMLHSVDFKRFLIEEKLVNADDVLEIKDVFGIKRNLKKAQIILTKSMLKCCGWLKDWKKLNKIADPMEYFFQQVDNFNHTMYVTGTDARFSNTGKIRLNYQFLSTLALKLEDFETIVEEHINKIENVEKFFINDLSSDVSDESVDDESSVIKQTENVRNKCLSILSKNEVFLHDPKIKEIIQDTKQMYEKNLCVGRLEVNGQQRYLSGDLLHFLINIATHIENIKITDEIKRKLYNKCLYSDRFYMAVPSESKFKLKYDKNYAFFRNPHLSRNEQILLKPYVSTKNNLYEKYFSHLTGIVMVASNKKSLAPMALGGADFDGDLVKIVWDKRITEAVKTGVYEINEGKNIERKLPVINIPSPKSKIGAEPDKGSINFGTIENTFSNNIGLISNIAAGIATKEYSNSPDEKYKNKCAECTIITGLEIDAAKTGVHPHKNILALMKLEINDNDVKNFFELKDLYSKKKYFTPWLRTENPENTTFSLHLSKKNLESKKRIRPHMTNIHVYNVNDEATSIKRLPGIYCKYFFDKRNNTSKNPKQREQHQFFEFQESGWKSKLDKEKISQVNEIVTSYLDITALAFRIKRYKESQKNSQFTGYIFNILQVQYDSLNQKLYKSGVKIQEALNQTYANISAILNDGDKIKEAIQRLINEKWQFTIMENRVTKILTILGITDESRLITQAMTELLSNFNNSGYMLFYYILKDLQIQFNEYLNSVEIYIEDENEVLENDELIEIDLKESNKKLNIKKELATRYYLSNETNESKSIWNKDLVQICRKYLNNIFDKDMNEALKYVVGIKSKDPRRKFFWNVFSKQEVQNNIIIKEEGEIIAE